MLDRCPKHGLLGLWIRAVYMSGFQSRSITAVIRPGDRMKDPEDFKYVPPGIAIPVRFIKTPGRGFEIPAVLYPDDGTTIERTEAFVKEIGALTPEDLAGMSPDTGTSELVRYHLATLYDTPLPAHDALVTVWRFKYLPTATD